MSAWQVPEAALAELGERVVANSAGAIGAFKVAFLFPWAVSLLHMPHAEAAYAFWSMMAFLGVLTVGFVYEWKKGALEWE